MNKCSSNLRHRQLKQKLYSIVPARQISIFVSSEGEQQVAVLGASCKHIFCVCWHPAEPMTKQAVSIWISEVKCFKPWESLTPRTCCRRAQMNFTVGSNLWNVVWLQRVSARTVVVVKWSACSPSTPMIQAYSFFCKICVWNNKNKQKEAGVGPFFKKSLSATTIFLKSII